MADYYNGNLQTEGGVGGGGGITLAQVRGEIADWAETGQPIPAGTTFQSVDNATELAAVDHTAVIFVRVTTAFNGNPVGSVLVYIQGGWTSVLLSQVVNAESGLPAVDENILNLVAIDLRGNIYSIKRNVVAGIPAVGTVTAFDRTRFRGVFAMPPSLSVTGDSYYDSSEHQWFLAAVHQGQLYWRWEYFENDLVSGINDHVWIGEFDTLQEAYNHVTTTNFVVDNLHFFVVEDNTVYQLNTWTVGVNEQVSFAWERSGSRELRRISVLESQLSLHWELTHVGYNVTGNTNQNRVFSNTTPLQTFLNNTLTYSLLDMTVILNPEGSVTGDYTVELRDGDNVLVSESHSFSNSGDNVTLTLSVGITSLTDNLNIQTRSENVTGNAVVRTGSIVVEVLGGIIPSVDQIAVPVEARGGTIGNIPDTATNLLLALQALNELVVSGGGGGGLTQAQVNVLINTALLDYSLTADIAIALDTAIANFVTEARVLELIAESEGKPVYERTVSRRYVTGTPNSSFQFTLTQVNDANYVLGINRHMGTNALPDRFIHALPPELEIQLEDESEGVLWRGNFLELESETDTGAELLINFYEIVGAFVHNEEVLISFGFGPAHYQSAENTDLDSDDFDGNLDDTVENVQELAERVDDLGGDEVAEDDAGTTTITGVGTIGEPKKIAVTRPFSQRDSDILADIVARGDWHPSDHDLQKTGTQYENEFWYQNVQRRINKSLRYSDEIYVLNDAGLVGSDPATEDLNLNVAGLEAFARNAGNIYAYHRDNNDIYFFNVNSGVQTNVLAGVQTFIDLEIEEANPTELFFLERLNNNAIRIVEVNVSNIAGETTFAAQTDIEISRTQINSILTANGLSSLPIINRSESSGATTVYVGVVSVSKREGYLYLGITGLSEINGRAGSAVIRVATSGTGLARTYTLDSNYCIKFNIGDEINKVIATADGFIISESWIVSEYHRGGFGFLDLVDTPDVYEMMEQGWTLALNNTGDGLTFVPPGDAKLEFWGVGQTDKLGPYHAYPVGNSRFLFDPTARNMEHGGDNIDTTFFENADIPADADYLSAAEETVGTIDARHAFFRIDTPGKYRCRFKAFTSSNIDVTLSVRISRVLSGLDYTEDQNSSGYSGDLREDLTTSGGDESSRNIGHTFDLEVDYLESTGVEVFCITMLGFDSTSEAMVAGYMTLERKI